MLDLEVIHKYGTDNSYTYFFHYKDSVCELVKVDVENNTISGVSFLGEESKWFEMLRELNITTQKQSKLEFDNLQKLLLLYKIMGFNTDDD